MSIAGAYKITSMMSEMPDMTWIVRGLRGIQTFLRRAALAIEEGDGPKKLQMIEKANQLIMQLDALARSAEGPLSEKLSAAYAGLHVRIVNANASNDAPAIASILSETQELEGQLRAISRKEAA